MGFETKTPAERLKELGLVPGTIDSEGNQTDPDILALIAEVESMQDHLEISAEAKSAADELLKRLSQK